MAGDQGIINEPYDSEMEAIDRLVENDENSNSSMPWDEDEKSYYYRRWRSS